MKKGFIYLWYDKSAKRYYLGCHWGKENDKYVSSSNWMKRCYYKRPEDFKRRIIENNILDRSLLFERELYWLSMIKETEIKPINPTPRYYNLNIRHNEHWLKNPEHIKTIGQKISIAKKGKSKGPRSQEVKDKISAATTGVKKTFTPEGKQAQRDAHLGKKHTQEWKDSNSARLKEAWANGLRQGKPQSEESNRKRSETSKGKCYTPPTEQSRKAQSEARKALWNDPEYRNKMTLIRQNRPKKSSVNESLAIF